MKILIAIILMIIPQIPNDRKAELALLGCAIQGKYDDLVSSDVGKDWFHDLKAKKLWSLLCEMTDAGDVVQPETVMHRVQSAEDVGLIFLDEVINACPTVSSWEHWLKLCNEKRKARVVQQKGLQLAALVDEGSDVEELVAKAESAIYALSSEVISGGRDARREGIREMVEILEDAHAGKETGLSTGFRSLDQILGGMRGGQLIVLAARPAVGKTALALNIADKLASEGKPVAFFSYEMTSAELCMRVISSRSDTDLIGSVLNRRADTQGRLQCIQKAAQHIAKLNKDPLHIIVEPHYNVAQICSRARRLVKEEGVRMIVVDYLQLVAPNKEDFRRDRHIQVATISKALKCLAMELDVPVLALAQLNRGAADNESPSIAHIKESGAIEQDANIVGLLSSDPTMYDGPNQLVKLAIGKNRGGRQGIVDLVFVRNKLRFEDAELPQHEKWLNQKAAEGAA